GQLVDLVVSRGGAGLTVVVPDLRGQLFSQAEARLGELGLQLREAQPREAAAPVAQLLHQEPGPGTREPVGSAVILGYAPGQPDEGRTPEPAASVPERRQVAQGMLRTQVTIQVAEGPAQEVLVVLIDDRGAREIRRAYHPGGSRVELPLEATGASPLVQVYLDGSMIQELPLR